MFIPPVGKSMGNLRHPLGSHTWHCNHNASKHRPYWGCQDLESPKIPKYPNSIPIVPNSVYSLVPINRLDFICLVQGGMLWQHSHLCHWFLPFCVSTFRKLSAVHHFRPRSFVHRHGRKKRTTSQARQGRLQRRHGAVAVFTSAWPVKLLNDSGLSTTTRRINCGWLRNPINHRKDGWNPRNG